MKNWTNRKRRCFVAGIFVFVLLAGIYAVSGAVRNSPSMLARRYKELKRIYPKFNAFDYYDVPEGDYLEYACKTSDMAVLARVTKGNEKAAKSDVVNRMRTTPFLTEKDFSLEDITEFLVEDPNRLNWGENCYEYEIEIEKILYTKTGSNSEQMSVVLPYSDVALFRAYTGMEVILFLTENEINQYYPFYVSEQRYVVPACTLLMGYEEYAGMTVKQFMKEVKRAYQAVEE